MRGVLPKLSLLIGVSFPVLAAEVAPQVRLPVVLQLVDKASVARERIYLADVAGCQGHSSLCDQAVGIDLGPAPDPGRTVFLNKKVVTEKVEQEWQDVDLTINGPNSLRIEAAAEAIESGDIEDALSRLLKSMVKDPDQLRLRVSRIQTGRDVLKRPGSGTIEVLDLEPGAQSESWLRRHLGGARMFRVKYHPDAPSQLPLTFSVQAQIEIDRHCAVAKDGIEHNDTLTKSVITHAWVTEPSQAQNCLQRPGPYLGFKLSRSIRAGDAISRTALKKPFLVRRGDLVRLEITQGGMMVTGQVKALSHAGAGDVIKAVYPETRKQVKIRIIGPGRAQYVF